MIVVQVQCKYKYSVHLCVCVWCVCVGGGEGREGGGEVKVYDLNVHKPVRVSLEVTLIESQFRYLLLANLVSLKRAVLWRNVA